MLVDRKRIEAVFKEYTDSYDSSNDKIRLKIEHTYRVAANSDQIARSLTLSADDIDLAWTIGMLHDVGRFEQLKRYDTFIDAKSVDHAQFGADLLFKEGLIKEFLPEDYPDLSMIETAIRNHNKYRIDEGLSEREELFSNIIRDADKVDIYKVVTEFPYEVVYGCDTEVLYHAEITPAVYEAFLNHTAVLRAVKRTEVDNVVSHSALAFELVFDKSLELAIEQGYLKQLMTFQSKNPKTAEEFDILRGELNDYLLEKTGRSL